MENFSYKPKKMEGNREVDSDFLVSIELGWGGFGVIELGLRFFFLFFSLAITKGERQPKEENQRSGQKIRLRACKLTLGRRGEVLSSFRIHPD